MNKLASQFIVDILNRSMSMPAGTVWLRDQDREIPNTKGLFMAVGLVSSVPMSSQVYIEAATPVLFDQLGQKWDVEGQNWDADPPIMEITKTQMQEAVQIDLFSRSNDALTRNWEVLAALRSIYSQQVQEKNAFRIARLPRSFLNTSSAEGGSQLNRYTITFSCLVWYLRALDLSSGDYYDDFRTRVDDEKTIGTPHGIIEFEITPEGIKEGITP